MDSKGERRTRATAEARAILLAARMATNVKLQQIADALEVGVSLVDAIFFGADDAQRSIKGQRYLRYADLYLLATCPETVALARELVMPLNAIFDRHRLTLQELDGLSSSPMTVDLARVLLRPMFERLFPVEMRSTIEMRPTQEAKP